MPRIRLLLVLFAVSALLSAPFAHGATSTVVVSQLYASGGNAGATYTNDFVELFNRGAAAVNLAGWTIQYASGASTSWQTTALSGSIGPGRYYLVQLASTAAVGSPLPASEATGTTNLAAAGGKVALLWADVVPDDAPANVHDFDHVVGADGFVMPATQHDAVLWLSGSAYDVVFELARNAIAELRSFATVVEETSSWPYMHDRDLTGFIDGTENPSLIDAPEFALIPENERGGAGTILLLQKWEHDATKWESLSVAEQERVIGRLKSDSTELEDKPDDSHVASTDQDRFGKIFRRNMPYGTVTNHGTMFVGFSADQRRLSTMLESMAGLANGPRDALTNYTRPLTGAYYFVPASDSLRRFIPDED
jgi:porphyrinogen peroxidase